MIATVLGFFLRNPLLIALAAVVVWGGAGRLEAANARRGAAKAQTTLAAEQSAHEAALAAARVAAADEEARILATQQKALHDADERTKRAQAARQQAAADLADSRQRLHDAVAARVGGDPSAENPAAIGERAAAAALGTLLNACAEEHQRLALDADTALAAARDAGQRCESSYDALTAPPTQP